MDRNQTSSIVCLFSLPTFPPQGVRLAFVFALVHQTTIKQLTDEKLVDQIGGFDDVDVTDVEWIVC